MSVCVVTGGTRGLGAAISLRVAREGGRVAAIFRTDTSAAERLLTQAASEGLAISIHQAELGDVQACRDVMAEIVAMHGPVGQLVNNHGVLLEAQVSDTTVELWNTVLDINTRATFFLTQAVWDGMVEARYGRVVNIGSVAGTKGNSKEAAYGASKAAMIGLTRSLARAGARKGITVNCVVPGVYETDMTNGMSEQDQKAIAAAIPIGRRGRPEELAHIVAALLHDEAAYVTGAVIQADGGLGMGA